MRSISALGIFLLLLSACSSEPEIPAWALATAVPSPDPNAVVATADPETVGLGASEVGATPGPEATPIPDVPFDVRTLSFTPGSDVRFMTQPGDLSWSVSVSATTANDRIGIHRVRSPDGETQYLADLQSDLLLVDDLHPRLLVDRGAVGLFVSGTSDEPLPAGEWSIDVEGTAADPLTRVAIKSGDLDLPQLLDINVWDTTGVADVQGFQNAWRTQMDAVLTPHGIAIGLLNLIPAGEGGAAFTTLGPSGSANDIHTACTEARTATNTPSDSALVVLVSDIGEDVLDSVLPPPGPEQPDASGAAAPQDETPEAEGTGTPTEASTDEATEEAAYRQPDGLIEGFAASAPGTPYLGPASHGCVAVRAGDVPSERGMIALHEVLHQAGLARHSTEQDGLDFDRLPDTAECPLREFDANADLEVSIAECLDGGGADNLMFWEVGGQVLTPEQGLRVRSHPLTHP